MRRPPSTAPSHRPRGHVTVFTTVALLAATVLLTVGVVSTNGPLRLRNADPPQYQQELAVLTEPTSDVENSPLPPTATSTEPSSEPTPTQPEPTPTQPEPTPTQTEPTLPPTPTLIETVQTTPSAPTARPLDVSLLHPRTVEMPPLQGERLSLSPAMALGNHIAESTQLFAQHGRDERGVHYRLKNHAVLEDPTTLQKDAVLLVVVLNDKTSWGKRRTSADFFALIGRFTHPKNQTSLTILTSSKAEFETVQGLMRARITEYAQFSLLFRNDFIVKGLTRKNRHEDEMQSARRSMLARYRNFALLATLEPWHQHVVWFDGDVHIVPPGLVTKMIQAERDILEPICYWGRPPSLDEYDRNAWAGRRAVPGVSPSDVRFMNDYRHLPDDFVALDSVGGTMLYVRADVHRQGVVFPTNFVIGTHWDSNGYDGIETEGLCYVAHFLGYKCWGMPHDPIYHVGEVYS